MITPRYRGVFPIAPTTFTVSGALDLVSQKRCIDAGSNGPCIPANFSGQFVLADDAREAPTCEFFAALSDALAIPNMVQDAPVSGTVLSAAFLAHIAQEIERFAHFQGRDARACRQATRVLVAKGLVPSRQRAGATVRPRSEWLLLEPDVLHWLSQTQMQTPPRSPATPRRKALPMPTPAWNRRARPKNCWSPTCWPASATCCRSPRESIKLGSQHPNTHALSLPRHKAILTALLNRDRFAAQQATLVQLKESREDPSEVLESGNGAI